MYCLFNQKYKKRTREKGKKRESGKGFRQNIQPMVEKTAIKTSFALFYLFFLCLLYIKREKQFLILCKMQLFWGLTNWHHYGRMCAQKERKV